MTLENIKKVKTERTKAVIMVHTYGLPSPAKESKNIVMKMK